MRTSGRRWVVTLVLVAGMLARGQQQPEARREISRVGADVAVSVYWTSKLIVNNSMPNWLLAGQAGIDSFPNDSKWRAGPIQQTGALPTSLRSATVVGRAYS